MFVLKKTYLEIIYFHITSASSFLKKKIYWLLKKLFLFRAKCFLKIDRKKRDKC